MTHEKVIEALELAHEFWGEAMEEVVDFIIPIVRRDEPKDLIPNAYGGGLCPACQKVSYSYGAVPEFCQCGQRLRGKDDGR